MEKISLLSLSIFFPIFFISLLQFIPENSEAALARAFIKKGDKFEFPVAGKLLVKRKTKKHDEEQYLWAGKCGGSDGKQRWTTDGKNQIGEAKLDWATGNLIIENFSEEDEGAYSFPLEKANPGLATSLVIVELKKDED
uniref:Uncharacterized protein n=1 Tax=Meloidogyne javanica TaxID=6303 RepID=A0A915LEC9_MELJA